MPLTTFNNQKLIDHTWNCSICGILRTKKMTRANANRVDICGKPECKREQARRRSQKHNPHRIR